MGTKAVHPEFSVTLIAMGIALAATPALSQGPMAPRPDVAPRVAPAAPQAPTVVPQAPVMQPQVPVVTPLPTPQQPGPTTPGTTRGGTGSGAGPGRAAINGDIIIDDPTTDFPVSVRGPGGAVVQSKTDMQGQTVFRQLAPGKYDVALPKIAGGVTMTTFVNGAPQARTVFPAGSSVGTFAVAKATDTVTLKFESNAPASGGPVRAEVQAGVVVGVLAATGTSPGGGGPAAPAGLRGGFIIPAVAIVAMIGPGGASVPGTTDATGQHSFQNLPAGRYTARLQGKDLPAGVTGRVAFVATVNGKETARTTFDVPAGGAGTRSFDLPFDVGPPPAGIKGSTAIVALLAVR